MSDSVCILIWSDYNFKGTIYGTLILKSNLCSWKKLKLILSQRMKPGTFWSEAVPELDKKI